MSSAFNKSIQTILLSIAVLMSGQSLAAEHFVLNNTILSKNGQLDLKSLRGQVLYVDFWASWCAPCKKSFPWLNSMQEKYGTKGFKVIGVNVDRDSRLAEKFLEKIPANFDMVFDPQGKLASQYKLVGMPSSYLIDKNGKIQHNHIGFRTNKTDDYEQSIQKLLE